MKLDRGRWYRWHSWCGLSLSILLSFICITGTLAVVSHEIDWLFNSALRVTPQKEVAELDWAEMYRQAQLFSPNSEIRSISAPVDAWFAAEVLAVKPGGQRFRIYINPHTHQITGTGPWMNWQRYLRQIHRHLMLPVTWGLTIVCATAVLLLISVVTGIVNYRRWWRGFLMRPRTNSRRLYWGDVHRLLGLWGLVFTLLISITGLWYLAERWGLAVQMPTYENVSVMEGKKRQARLPIDAELITKLHQQVKQKYPALNVSQVTLKHSEIRFMGQAEAVLVDRANYVAFDSGTGLYLRRSNGLDLGIHGRISEAADPLHFGTFFGLSSKLLWFLFGVLLTALIVSGSYIYGLRLIKRQVKHAQSTDIKTVIWRGMGLGGWVSSGLVLLCLLLVV